LTAAIGIRGELLDIGDKFAAGSLEDVEVGKHLSSVDRHVELTGADGSPVFLGEVEPDGIRGSG
jgi:hypothetical protein